MSGTMSLGSLVLDLKAETSSFIRQMHEAQKTTSSFATEAQKASRSLSDMSGSLASMAAGIASLGTAKLAMDMARVSAQFADAKTVFEAAGNSLDDFRAKTKGLLSDQVLVQKFNFASQMGISKDAFMQFANVSDAAAKKMGISQEFAFESLIVGTARASKLILDNVGIMIDADAAYKKYAASIHVGVNSLTDLEKQQAFTNAVLAEGSKMISEVSKLGATASDVYDQWDSATSNLKTSMGAFFHDLGRNTGVIANFVAAMNELSAAMQSKGSAATFGTESNTALRNGIRAFGSALTLGMFEFRGGFDPIDDSGANKTLNERFSKLSQGFARQGRMTGNPAQAAADRQDYARSLRDALTQESALEAKRRESADAAKKTADAQGKVADETARTARAAEEWAKAAERASKAVEVRKIDAKFNAITGEFNAGIATTDTLDLSSEFFGLSQMTAEATDIVIDFGEAVKNATQAELDAISALVGFSGPASTKPQFETFGKSGNSISFESVITDFLGGSAGGALGAAIGTIIAPGIGTAIGKMLGDGAQQMYGGIFDAAIGAASSFLSRTNAMGDFDMAMQNATQGIVDAIEPVGQGFLALAPIAKEVLEPFAMIISANTGLMELLWGQFQLLGIEVSTATGALAFFQASLTLDSRQRDALYKTAEQAFANAEKIAAMTFDGAAMQAEAMADHQRSLDANTDALNAFSRNLPAGFRAGSARYESEQPGMGRSAARAAADEVEARLRQRRQDAARRAAQEAMENARRHNYRQTGNPSSSRNTGRR